MCGQSTYWDDMFDRFFKMLVLTGKLFVHSVLIYVLSFVASVSLGAAINLCL